MPKISKESTEGIDMGPMGTDWRGDLDGYTGEIVRTNAAADLTELLRGLPGDVCPSPHWGYVFAGRMWFRHADRLEEFGPGDAYYVEPGHTSGADGGSEFLIFSPTEVIAEVEAHMMRRAQEGAPIGV
ncbi:MAG TPA: cupin domain-containing protein [Actinomycetota bacterium]|nr:cupin domain-containing protein [Actinomycetota bacterium]